MNTAVDERLHSVADDVLTEPGNPRAISDAWVVVLEVIGILDRDIMQRPPVENVVTLGARRLIEILAGADHPVTLDAMSTLALALVRIRYGGATEEQVKMVRATFSTVRDGTGATAWG